MDTQKLSFATLLGAAFDPLYQENKKIEIHLWFYAKMITGTFSLILLLLASFFQQSQSLLPQETIGILTLALASFIQITIGLPFYLMIITRPKKNGSKLSFALAAIASYIYALYQWMEIKQSGFFITSAFILFIATILIYLEQKNIFTSLQLIKKIHSLKPKTAAKQSGSHFKPVETDKLVSGDIIKINAGETIPVDGIIISGTTSVDESSLTGQTKPLLKGQGEEVIGATFNRDSAIIIKLHKNPSDNILNHIVSAIENNLGDNHPITRKMETMGKTVCFLGILSSLITAWYFHTLLMAPLDVIFKTSLAVLISFSAFSLTATTVIAVNLYLSDTFHKGVYFNKSGIIEKLARLSTLFFDKTGTLTKGTFEYSQSFIELGTNQGQLLCTLFSLEKYSNHPLSQSMETHPWYQEIAKYPVREFKTHPGLGVCGYIQPKAKREYFAAIGNLRFLKRMQMHISKEMKAKMDDLECMGETVLLCGYNRQVKGLITFADVLRPHVRETLQHLKKLKVEPAIITGDTSEDIVPLTASLGLNKVYSRCTPDEKTNKICKEINTGKITGLVGSSDDESAFEKAQISITIDTGTQIENKKANVLMMGSDFKLVSWLIEHSKKLVSKIYLYRFLSVFTSLVLACFATLGLASTELVTALVFCLNTGILVFTYYSQKDTQQHLELTSASLHNT